MDRWLQKWGKLELGLGVGNPMEGVITEGIKLFRFKENKVYTV
jgi:hypothetical protein